MKDGFPELIDSFLSGQDVLYGQFNEVNFYVEDVGQEHFYFNVFKKLFPDIQFDKIFPLNGKKNVKDAANLTVGDKKKIYIVDLDFDNILGLKEVIPNLFYLERYSIENYLISKKALFEVIREKNSRLKNQDIEKFVDYQVLLKECALLLLELSCTFILIQKYSLGIDYFGINPARDFDFSKPTPCYKNKFIKEYIDSVDDALKKINRRYTLKAQVKSLTPYFKSLESAISTIPGKYLLNLIKNRLESLSLILQVNVDSFSYKLSKEADTMQLSFLRDRVVAYMK